MSTHAHWSLYALVSRRLGSRLDKTRLVASKIWSCPFFNKQDPIMKLQASTFQADRKLTVSVLMGFVRIATLCLNHWAAFYHFCPCQEVRPSLTEVDIQRGSKKRGLDQLRRSYVWEKRFTVIEIWECHWWRLYKRCNYVKNHIREKFP